MNFSIYEMSFYEILWIFLIYSFLGWCAEVCYVGLQKGHFVNRGFLNGPYCPIYGFGVLMVVSFLTPLKENFIVLFLGSVFFTSLLEFVTGFLLEKVFHNQWWDYSTEPFNLCGYICLKFSIMWGMGCLIIVDIVHPVLMKMAMLIPHIIGIIILVLFFIAFAVDCGITVSTILKFNKRLKLMEEIADKLKEISNEIGENLFDSAVVVKERSDDLKETAETKKEKFIEEFSEEHEELVETMEAVKDNLQSRKIEGMELLNKYKQLLEERKASHVRLIKAFPGMKPAREKQREFIEKIRENIEEKKSQK